MKLQNQISLGIVSNLIRNVSKPYLLRSNGYKSIHSMPNPFNVRSIRSHSILSQNFHGFISKQLSLSTYSMFKSVADCRLGFFRSHFSRPSFLCSPRYGSFSLRRSWLPGGATSDGLVLGLILANVAIYIAWQIADRDFMVDNFMVSLDNARSGRLHTLITSAFSHLQLEHIITNMIGLYFFGTSIGRAFGPDFLLKLYLAGAVGGSVFYLLQHAYLAVTSESKGFFFKDQSRTPGLGASGAVNAIMLLNIFLFPRSTVYLEFIIPVPAILLGIFLIGNDTLRIIRGDDHISGSAHLGGVAVAAVAWALIRRGHF